MTLVVVKRHSDQLSIDDEPTALAGVGTFVGTMYVLIGFFVVVVVVVLVDCVAARRSTIIVFSYFITFSRRNGIGLTL